MPRGAWSASRRCMVGLLGGALALAGCQAPGTPPPSSTTTAQDAVSFLNDSADFETGLTQESADLAAAEDLGQGASMTLGLLALKGYRAQDVRGAYSGGYPTPAATTLPGAIAAGPWAVATASAAPRWMKNASGVLLFPRVISHGPAGSSTENYYAPTNATAATGPFAYSRVVTQDGAEVESMFATPEASGDLTILPAPFNTLPSLPASASVRRSDMTFFTYAATGSSAVGRRWAVYDENRRLSSWNRALQITRPGPVVVQHYDLATQYQVDPQGRRVPYEYITDDQNAAASTHLHVDRTYDPATTTWTGNGTWTGKDNVPRTLRITWSTVTHARTRAVTWTNTSNQQVILTESFKGDRSGSGNLTVNGQVFATMTWERNGKGVMTLANGQTFPFRVHY